MLARTRPPREGRGPSDGLELFLVEKDRGTFPAGVTGTPIAKIGYFGLTTWQLELDGLRLPADALQDTGEEEGQGFKHSLGWLHVAGRRRLRARSVSPEGHSRTRSPTASSGSSSASRSATSR